MAGKAQRTKKWGSLLAAVALVFALVFFADGFRAVGLAASGKANAKANIRKSPSTSSEAVGSTSKGSTIEILSQTTGSDGKVWYEVTVDANTKGYIRSDLVDVAAGTTIPGSGDGDSAGAGSSVAGDVEAVTPVGATVAGSNTVRVRTSASTTTSNNILTTVTKGTEVTVIGKTVGSDKKTWYQVKLTVEGKEVVGYVRSDYLALTGEIKPLEADPITDVNPTDPQIQEPEIQEPEVKEPVKRYETALEGENWKLIDYEEAVQYDIKEFFDKANEYKTSYETAQKKLKARTGWMVFFLILALAAIAGIAYLLFRLKEIKEEAFITSIENNTPRRTAERPRGEARGGQNAGRERPAIRDGLEPRREENQRPANGQRSSGNRPAQGQRPEGARAQRPEGAQGQRPANPQAQQGQRPANPQAQQGQRPANPQARQGQRPEGAQGQRPANPQAQQSQRPANPQAQQGQRPANPQARQGQRPEGAQGQRPANPQPQQAPQTAARPKNFAQDSDDMEFEFLNWDSDE